jgi:hypothetical protein
MGLADPRLARDDDERAVARTRALGQGLEPEQVTNATSAC